MILRSSGHRQPSPQPSGVRPLGSLPDLAFVLVISSFWLENLFIIEYRFRVHLLDNLTSSVLTPIRSNHTQSSLVFPPPHFTVKECLLIGGHLGVLFRWNYCKLRHAFVRVRCAQKPMVNVRCLSILLYPHCLCWRQDLTASLGWLGNTILNSQSYLPLLSWSWVLRLEVCTTMPGHPFFFGGGVCFCYVIVLLLLFFCLFLRQGCSQNPEVNQSIQPISSKDLPVLLFPECIGVIDVFPTAWLLRGYWNRNVTPYQRSHLPSPTQAFSLSWQVGS